MRSTGATTLGLGAVAAAGASAYNFQQGGVVPRAQGAGYAAGAAALGYGAYKLGAGNPFDRLEYLKGAAEKMGVSASRYKKFGGFGIGSLALGAGIYTKMQKDQGDYGAMALGGAATLGLTAASISGFQSGIARQRVADSLTSAVETATKLGKRINLHSGRASSFRTARNFGAAGLLLGGAATIHGNVTSNNLEANAGTATAVIGGAALLAGSAGKKYQVGKMSKFKSLREDVLSSAVSLARTGPTAGPITKKALESTGRAVLLANRELRPSFLSRSMSALRRAF